MKKFSLLAQSCLGGFVFLALSAPIFALSSSHHKHQERTVLKIVDSGYSGPLLFGVQKNRDNTPKLPVQFVLNNPNGLHFIKTTVLVTHEETYFNVSSLINVGDNAYFGISKVRIKKNKYRLQAHGYLDHGIAYSWQGGKNLTIKFCSPQQYTARGNHC
jgi:hypothetical protein